jgi:hypothetical protein
MCSDISQLRQLTDKISILIRGQAWAWGGNYLYWKDRRGKKIWKKKYSKFALKTP